MAVSLCPLAVLMFEAKKRDTQPSKECRGSTAAALAPAVL
jgi:hypothetical protein